ncbi:MAG: CAP domain-containing protein [Planctomycetia bacterium]
MKNPRPSSAVSWALRSLPLVLVAAGGLCADELGPRALSGSPDAEVVASGAMPAPSVLKGSPDGELAAAIPTARDFSMLSEVNRARAQRGLPALRYEARLFACAREHSEQQVRGKFLGHGDRAGGTDTFSARLRTHGYAGRTIAEVVAGDYVQVGDALQKWLDSPAHADMLLDPDMVEAAFACVDGDTPGTNRWTGVLADPQGKATPVAAAAPAPLAAVPAPAMPNPATRVSAPPAMAPRSTPGMTPARPALTSAQPLVGSPDGNLVPPPLGARTSPVVPSAARVQPVVPVAPRMQPVVPVAPRAQPVVPAPRTAVQPTPPSRAVPPASAQPWSPNSMPTYIPTPPARTRKTECVGGT